MGFRPIAAVLVAALTLGCSRDDETSLKAMLNGWFYVDETLFFASRTRCTAAVFRVATPTTRAGMPVYNTANEAKQAFNAVGLSAFQIPGYSPNDLTDELLLRGRGSMGKQALAAAAQAVPCFDGTKAEGQLRDALTRPGAMLAYDRGSEGLIVLDPATRRLFYVAGDVW